MSVPFRGEGVRRTALFSCSSQWALNTTDTMDTKEKPTCLALVTIENRSSDS